MFLRVVLSYILFLMGYIAYILHTSTPDQLHAGSLWLSSFTSFFLGVFTSFTGFEKNTKIVKEIPELEQTHDSE
jgi:hypothetical protein